MTESESKKIVPQDILDVLTLQEKEYNQMKRIIELQSKIIETQGNTIAALKKTIELNREIERLTKLLD